MRCNGCRKTLFNFVVASILLLNICPLLHAQKAADSAGAPSASPDAAAAVQSLADSLRDLQSQVQSLNAQLRELRNEQQSAAAEAQALRVELSEMRQRGSEPSTAAFASGPQNYGRPRGVPDGASNFGSASSQPQPASQTTSTNDRLARLEESQEVTAANVRELSQTRVESGSKYRLRLSGIVLLSMFENRGAVDNFDVPEVALPPKSTDSGGAFGGSVRQSQINLDAFGPDIAGAHTSAAVSLDFAGGFVASQNGATHPLARLRTANVRFDWTDTSIIAGQDALFFVPLTPSSIASLAAPALSYAGDLWGWTPQVRIEHRIHFTDGSHLLLQSGVLDSLSGDVASAGYERIPTWGERSGSPAFASRVAWSHSAFGDRELTLGAAGYYGRQDWGFGRGVDAWAGTVDMDLPLGKLFDLTAAFYRGRALGGFGGGIGQSIVISGPFGAAATFVQGLQSAGGWAQLKFKPRANFEINGAFGEDNPFASELKRFPGTPAHYGSLLTRNLSPFVNFIYQPRSDLLLSAEYRYLQTFLLNSGSQNANLVNLSLGYTF
jgi:hypothetical protein